MRKTLTCFTTILFLLSYTLSVGQTDVQLEVAPYFVPCDETEASDCLQLLDTDGLKFKVIPLDGIKGFTAEKGYEYTLNVDQVSQGDTSSYILKKELSKMWVPQFASDAPLLEGNFQIVGFNGKSIDTNDLNLVINANNSVMFGSTGCNNYHLFFKQLGYSLVFSKILATHLFCASRAALEEEYFVIFNSVHHFEIDGDVLRLFDITDRALLEAVRLR